VSKKPTTSAIATAVNESGLPHELADLFLSEASVSRPGIRPGQPPTDLKILLKVTIHKPAPDQQKLLVRVNIVTDAFYPDSDSAAVRIAATFVVIYRFVKPMTEEAQTDSQLFRVFGQQNGVYHVWPYWREFVQSATTRMGLPPLRMPLLAPSELQFHPEDGEGEAGTE